MPIVMARPALAPAVNPSNPGSASGFLVIPCMMAPETASAAPTKIAPTSRGKRISRMMEIFSPVALESVLARRP